MAATVMGRNIIDNTMLIAAYQAIDVAHGHLARAADVCDRYRRDLPYQPAPAGNVPHHLPTAMNHVRRAIISARRVSVSHAGSGHVFSLSAGTRVGLRDSAPLSWQTWEGRHAAAAAHAATALQRLNSAWSHGRAATDAVDHMLGTSPMRMRDIGFGIGWPHAANQLLDITPESYDLNIRIALTFGVTPPAGFSLWDAWGHAAEQLLRRAAEELAMAWAALEQMRRDVVAEFFDAWRMLMCDAAD